MNELDFPDYNLTFIERETGKVFKGKRLTNDQYGILIDPTIGLKEFLSCFKFKKRFKSAVSNRRFHNSSVSKCKTIYHFQ
jgi:hypothetical protein